MSSFRDLFDVKGSICLLEGKRIVKPEDVPKLVAIGKWLATNTKYIKFRSGNAQGADQFFSEGVASVAPERLEVISPYRSHRKTKLLTDQVYGLDEIDLVEEPELVYRTKESHNAHRLIDRYVEGSRDRNAMKAAYLLRDTVKVTGTSTIPPATVALFYDDLEKPRSGGTGHTMQVCENLGIPFYNQEVWMKWLDD